jgi:hypothetical protein
MIKASARMADGRILLVLGVSEGNLTRLRQGQPIAFDAAAMRFAPGDALGQLVLFYGKDEAELARTMRTLIGPETEIIAIPQSPRTVS